MSRLSRANVKARESVFNTGPELYRGEIQAVCPPNLLQCVAALQDGCEEANAAQILLRSGTEDLPRMTNILANEQLYLLVNESRIKRYKADLIDEIEPAIIDLIDQTENGLKSLLKKESQLKAKAEAAQSRPPKPAGMTTASQKLEQRRLHALTKQRERLEMEMRELEAEVLALERQAAK